MEKPEQPNLLGGRKVFGDSSRSSDVIKNERQMILEGDRFCREKYPDQVFLLQHWLEEIHPQTIEAILKGYATRSGVQSERVNFPKSIFFFESEAENFDMAFAHFTNCILINPNAYRNAAASLSMSYEAMEATAVETLIHEYCHAAGVNIAYIRQEGDEDVITSRTGLSMRVDKLPVGGTTSRSRQTFEFLNEGISEKLTREVMREYVRRSPHGPNPEVFADISKRLTEKVLLPSQLFLDAMISAIAERAGVPEDVVWHGFLREYFTGETSVNNELVPLFNELFENENFSFQLAYAKSASDVEQLLESTPTLKSKFIYAVERLVDQTRR